MKVLKSEKPGEAPPPPPPPAPGQPAPPPPAPPAPVIDYYLITERTRVPAVLPKIVAERIAPDIDTVLPTPGSPAPASPAPVTPAPVTPAPVTPAPAHP